MTTLLQMLDAKHTAHKALTDPSLDDGTTDEARAHAKAVRAQFDEEAFRLYAISQRLELVRIAHAAWRDAGKATGGQWSKEALAFHAPFVTACRELAIVMDIVDGGAS